MLQVCVAVTLTMMQVYDRIITNRNLAPLTWDGNYVVQYNQKIDGQPREMTFSMANIPLPHYMVLQLYDSDYFTGEPDNDFTKAIYKPIQLNIDKIRLKYGNKNLNYQTANFNIGEEGSELLRQEIMKTSDVFDSKEMNQGYYDKMEHYQQHHWLLSFCSDEKNHTLLRPLDYNGPPGQTDTLSVSLIGNSRKTLKPGNLVVTLIYKDMGLQYDLRSGTFLERNLKSLVISN